MFMRELLGRGCNRCGPPHVLREVLHWVEDGELSEEFSKIHKSMSPPDGVTGVCDGIMCRYALAV